MSDALIIGLDLGTTNAKAAAFDLHGRPAAEVSVPYPTYYLQHGWVEQNPADWTAALSDCLRKLISALGDRKERLVGIGLSAHGPGLILIDEKGQPLVDAVPTWQDERCLDQARRLLDTLGSTWPGLGLPMSNFPPKLLWAIDNHPKAAGQAKYALGIKDFLIHWLTGEIATEPSSGPGGNDWWVPVFEACNWPLKRLAPVVSSSRVVGRTRLELARTIGLHKPLPVVAGLNDGASATLSTGAVSQGDCVITLATNGVVRVVVPEVITDQERLDYSLFCWPYLDGQWIIGGQTKAGASALQWYGQLLAEDPGEIDFDAILAEAVTSPSGSRGVLFLPYLLGRGSPNNDSTARGAFFGLTAISQRADLGRSVLEGVAFALREVFEIFESMALPTRRVLISGGGARSELWRDIISAVLERPLTYFATDSTLGAAIVTTISLGFYEDHESATKAMVRPLGKTTPESDEMAVYATAYQLYQKLSTKV